MRQRLLRSALLIFAITLLISGVFIFANVSLWRRYRASSNAELSNLLGAIAQEHPELDTNTIIHALTQKDETAQANGEAILRSYGYTANDFISSSTGEYAHMLILVTLLTLTFLAAIFLAYFWFEDSRRYKNIRALVDYVQKLNDHVYDLRIKANTEDDLSLLSNELYKITVTLKEASEQDRKARHNLETALADISHQLKTPLTSLQVALDNLESDPDMPLVVRQDFLRSSSRQVVIMSDLVTTLLNLAKFDNGTIRMQRRIMPISGILDRVYMGLEILADLADIQINIEGDLTAQVKLDPHWQAEALSNIIKNCIEHSPPHSVVSVSVEDSVFYTRILIRDHGTGIDSQDLYHIFERFYKTRGSKATSVGIGLSFAKSVIEADNGQIQVKSTSGSGTTFIITYFH